MPTAFEARVLKSPNRRASVPAIALTTKQKRLIRESVLTLEPAFDLVGQLFFLKLYRLDPAFRARFAGTPRDARPEIHGGAEARHRLAQP